LKKQNKAYLYASFAVIGWATAATAFKITLEHLDFLQMLFWASLFSMICMAIALLIQNKISILKSFTFRDYFLSALLGFLNPFAYYVILFKAYSLLPAQEAQPLNYIWPIVLVLLSAPLLKQKVYWSSIIALFISFAGVITIATRGDILSFTFSEPLGAFLALSTAFVWSVYWLLNTKDKKDANAMLLVNFVFGTIYSLIACLLFSSVKIPDIHGFISSAWVGIFEMGISFIMWGLALKYSESTAKISNLIFIVPFLSLLVIAIVLKENITLSTIIGLFLIMGGIAMEQFGKRLFALPKP
jgi:drug/metabolite transporter (DMT)-like permease